MKRKQLTISIPQPCHEKWDDLTPKDKGAFCASCAKVVIDFSTMTNSEIITYIEQHKNQKLCGRFKKEQVEAPLITHEGNTPWYSKIKHWVLGALTLYSFPGLLKAKVVENNIWIHDDYSMLLPIKISGHILNDRNENIYLAEVKIYKNNKLLKTVFTDSEGFFQYETMDTEESKSMYAIEISARNYIEFYDKVDVNTDLSIQLKSLDQNEQINVNELVLSGIVVNKHTHEKISFANIVIKHHTIGTVTDEEGLFSLSIPSNLDSLDAAIVVFSQIGYKAKEIPLLSIINQNSLVINLDSEMPQYMGLVVYKYDCVLKKENSFGMRYTEPDPIWKDKGFSSRKEYKLSKKNKK